MTILVTGGTGLVGARLLPRLRDAGHDCRALVRPGRTVPEGIEPVEGDLLDPTTLAAAVDGVTAVVHLAALFRTPDDDAIWSANLDGTRNLIAATKAGAPEARFVMASTILVYDEDATRPSREDDPTTPEAAYPASKVVAERELRESTLTWSVLRFGFVYGDGDGHIESVPRIMTAWGWHPARVLSVVHHRDIAGAVELALSGAVDGRTLNVAAEAPSTVYELAALAGEPMEPSSEPLTNPWMGHVDVSLARSLGFRPTVPTVYDALRDDLL